MKKKKRCWVVGGEDVGLVGVGMWDGLGLGRGVGGGGDFGWMGGGNMG